VQNLSPLLDPLTVLAGLAALSLAVSLTAAAGTWLFLSYPQQRRAA
jgi:hypothetical protein